MISNLLGETTEEEAMATATHVAVPRFDATAVPRPPRMSDEEVAEWLRMWAQITLGDLHGFPVWEREVHDMLASNLPTIKSVFAAYSASSLGGDAATMDLEELHDLVIETALAVTLTPTLTLTLRSSTIS